MSREAPEGGPLPRAFGRYTLFDHIGRGGMADIYVAMLKDGLVERRVVLKQVLPELSGDDGFGRMLIAEAKLAANLRHANIVQVVDLGREEDRLFIVMEYVEGFDLNQLLRRLSKARIALPAQFAVFVVRETLRALDYAHRARDAEGRPLGIVHRDVSPSNVLVSLEGEVKLCDFGIARALSAPPDSAADQNRIARSRVVGKSAYMAPEHARGEEIDARADVFAAGIQLWELCAGRRLYKGSDEQMLQMARRGEVPALPERGLPEHAQLQSVIDRALAADRSDRFQTAAAFLEALEDWAVTGGLLASQLRFGTFLTENFGEAVAARRRREDSVTGDHELPPPELLLEAEREAQARLDAERAQEAKRIRIADPEGAGTPPVWLLALAMAALLAVSGIALWLLFST